MRWSLEMSIDRPKDDLVCQGEGSEAYSFAIWYVDINGGGGSAGCARYPSKLSIPQFLTNINSVFVCWGGGAAATFDSFSDISGKTRKISGQISSHCDLGPRYSPEKPKWPICISHTCPQILLIRLFFSRYY